MTLFTCVTFASIAELAVGQELVLRHVSYDFPDAAGAGPVPRLLEVVGLAGTGKTTLTGQLSQCPWTARGQDYETANLKQHVRQAPFTARQLLGLLPRLVRINRADRGLSREEVKKLIYLSGWHQVFRRQQRSAPFVVADQGPVFCLATLQGFGPARLRARPWLAWWDRMWDLWAQELDGVVYLECCWEILQKRIEVKPRHCVQGQSRQQVEQYLRTYQSAFESVISALQSRGPVQVLRLNTGTSSLAESKRQVLRHWGYPEAMCADAAATDTQTALGTAVQREVRR